MFLTLKMIPLKKCFMLNLHRHNRRWIMKEWYSEHNYKQPSQNRIQIRNT